MRRKREQKGEEERDRGRERVRESSYYKLQSLPWAYDKGLSTSRVLLTAVKMRAACPTTLVTNIF